MNQHHTVISREYPMDWKQGLEPYYPVNDDANHQLFARYQALADSEQNVIFGGRLGQYRYYDMDDTIRAALDCARDTLNKNVAFT
jgi:UDP-galactopyranose mutase